LPELWHIILTAECVIRGFRKRSAEFRQPPPFACLWRTPCAVAICSYVADEDKRTPMLSELQPCLSPETTPLQIVAVLHGTTKAQGIAIRDSWSFLNIHFILQALLKVEAYSAIG
jgi:hypothetical protein